MYGGTATLANLDVRGDGGRASTSAEVIVQILRAYMLRRRNSMFLQVSRGDSRVAHGGRVIVSNPGFLFHSHMLYRKSRLLICTSSRTSSTTAVNNVFAKKITNIQRDIAHSSCCGARCRSTIPKNMHLCVACPLFWERRSLMCIRGGFVGRCIVLVISETSSESDSTRMSTGSAL